MIRKLEIDSRYEFGTFKHCIDIKNNSSINYPLLIKNLIKFSNLEDSNNKNAIKLTFEADTASLEMEAVILNYNDNIAHIVDDILINSALIDVENKQSLYFSKYTQKSVSVKSWDFTTEKFIITQTSLFVSDVNENVAFNPISIISDIVYTYLLLNGTYVFVSDMWLWDLKFFNEQYLMNKLDHYGVLVAIHNNTKSMFATYQIYKNPDISEEYLKNLIHKQRS